MFQKIAENLNLYEDVKMKNSLFFNSPNFTSFLTLIAKSNFDNMTYAVTSVYTE